MILEGAALSGDDIDWETVPGVWKGSKSKKSYHSSLSSDSNRGKTLISSTSFDDNIPFLDPVLSSILDQEEITQLQFEQLQVNSCKLETFILDTQTLYGFFRSPPKPSRYIEMSYRC